MDVIILILAALSIFGAVTAAIFTYLDRKQRHQR